MEFISLLFSGKINLNCKAETTRSTLARRRSASFSARRCWEQIHGIVIVFEKREAGGQSHRRRWVVCLAGGTVLPPRGEILPHSMSSPSNDFVSCLTKKSPLCQSVKCWVTVFAFASQLDPSLEAKVNVQKQSVMLEEEYEVSRGGPSNQRIGCFLLF